MKSNMNNLIAKAIQAIKDGKTDYAIGLLEGVMEISPEPKPITYIPAKETIAFAGKTPSEHVANEAKILESSVANKIKEIESMIKYE